jgi:hypothetical protein
VWHVLTLGAMVTCGWLAAWQWQRAGSAMGSALNVGYGLQWPVFAVFFGVMWWRMLRMEAAKLTRPGPDAAGDHAVGDHAAGDHAAGDHAAGDHAAASAAPAVSTGLGTAEPGPATSPDAPSPFGPRPRSARPVTDEDDPELAAYNRMLAELAARHRED